MALPQDRGSVPEVGYERLGLNMPEHVRSVFDGFPERPRRLLLEVRELLFDTAARTTGVGRLTETLKWGQPAYLTEETRSGSTIRLGWSGKTPDVCGVYFICHSGIVQSFKTRFPDELNYEGERAILLSPDCAVPVAPLCSCLAEALTWHRNKTGRREQS